MATNTIGDTTFTSKDGNYTVTTGNQTVTLNPNGNGSYTNTINGVAYSVKVNTNTDVSTFSIGPVSFTANGADGYSVSGKVAAGSTGATVNVQLNLDSNFNVSNVQVGAAANFGSVKVGDDFNPQGEDVSSNLNFPL